jgi:hypothetical protein
MPLAESEAKFKYCPLLKTHDDKMKFCQAGMCMMWRAESAEEGSRGWCGLAGNPLTVALALAEAASGAKPPCMDPDKRKRDRRDEPRD